MKKIQLLLIACLISQALQSQVTQQNQSKQEKLHVGFNKNVELLGFGYFLLFEGQGIESKILEIDGEALPKKDWHNYGFHFYQQYKQYAESENLIKSLSVANHLWLDYLIKLLLQVDEFPNARLKSDIDESVYIRFSTENNLQEARENVKIFLDGLNAFYKEVQFDQYLNESKDYYETALKEVEHNLPNSTFIEDLEQFYGRKFGAYNLVPSLTIPKGMGFGINTKQDQIFNVFGAFNHQVFLNTDEPEMGFDNPQKIRELSIHEFGHSFVNPIVVNLPEESFLVTRGLFEPIRNAMADQAYNTWTVSLCEHFVRAGEIMIASKTASKEDAARLSKDYIETRQFIYIPTILKELETYTNAGTYTYEEAVKRAFSALEDISDTTIQSTESTHFPNNPKEAQFHTEDISRFWEVFDRTYPRFKGRSWQEEYIEQGSIGLKGFIKNRIGNGKLLAKTIKRDLKYYQAIRASSLTIEQQKQKFYASFYKLKELYPKAVFPDVYFVIGRRNSGGTIFGGGLIIGAEKFGRPAEDFKPDIDIEFLDDVIAHELIHFQQNYVADNSLLAQCIREGAADYLGEMLTGTRLNADAYNYGEAHEVELREEFMSRKNDRDWSNWLYRSKDKSRPEDLGYWMGYKICKAYYDKMENKSQAISDILNIQNFDDFLIRSGY